ncbi:MAG TPA: hypothetical protein PKM00_00585 [Prolixibacteraceae bacterium]|nr:hypothetical protein [Prolixibacteraceae bacterium]
MEDKLTSHSTRCRKKLSHLIFGMFLLVFPAGAGGKTVTGPVMPGNLKDYVAAIQTGELGNSRKSIRYKSVSKNVTRVRITFDLKDTLHLDDWQVNILPAFSPDFHWAPHLTPTDEHIIAQHLFRSPAMVCSSSGRLLTLIPDLDLLAKTQGPPWYMDLDARNNVMTLGMSHSAVREHVLYVRTPGACYSPGKVEIGFYLITSDQKDKIFNPWRKINSFLWKKWGKQEWKKLAKSRDGLKNQVAHAYNWAFGSWEKSVWQEFELNGQQVGAPVFIVNTTQSPNYPGEVNEREFRSVWNQAWFSSLRSAQGLYRYARRENNRELMNYALKTKELALAFPQRNGLFPGLTGTEMETVEVNGEKYNRSKGWNTFFFGNSNRNPYTWDARLAPYHILDMSFTANQMLIWYTELEKDERLLTYATQYADALLKLQDEEGFFPGWLSIDSLKPMEYLNKSPETSMSVTFLLRLYQVTQERKYLVPALKALNAVADRIIMEGQWEDFETYWSCCRYGSDHLVGKKVLRNNQFKQNTLSMYWTAEALLDGYLITGERKYLQYGERTLDELLMYQASWQPPYIYIRAIGGFGVMNCDGEWNDSRQSLFSELILRYGRELHRNEYLQRGLAALYASFEMMYCPENPETKAQWEKAWPFFGEEDYGFMMENYGHGGVTGPEGIGIGEFTIYDWGNGAAAEAYNRIADHFGEKFIARPLWKSEKIKPINLP